MPKITGFTPAWLCKPAPGYKIFQAADDKTSGGQTATYKTATENARRHQKPGPRRTVAHRGAEVFVAVGKEIRWGNLACLKESWDSKQLDLQLKGKGAVRDGGDGSEDENNPEGYRIIKMPVADEIRQIVVSPQSDYLAVLTRHTVHVAVLPDSSHLTGPDSGPLRLKTYTLGPVTHVTTQSPVTTALWHPLGVNGSCLITVTEDAIVRVWELSIQDRWSFDRPTLAIDLKKLADGISLDQDFGASVSGTSKGFSPDSVEMEVASACFASRGSGGWSPMTLWVAMREGDVYALCPLLPEKWSPPPTLIPSLSISIVAKVASMEDDPEVLEHNKILSQQQLSWMSDLDDQDPVASEAAAGEPPTEVYKRPIKPGKVPKLQGPFEIELSPEESEDELDNLLTDIFVIGAKINTEELMSGEDEDLEMDDIDQEGLSAGVVCLLSSSGRLTICLDLNGIEAQWLPTRKAKNRKFVDMSDPPSLLAYEILETLRPEEKVETGWPLFSPDVYSRYSFFITHTSSITFISLSPWVFRLESELQGNAGPGVGFRIGLLANGKNSLRERLFSEEFPDQTEQHLPACLTIRDPDLGFCLLSVSPSGPITVTFEVPDEEIEISRSSSPSQELEVEPQPLILYAPRPVYQPSPLFGSTSALPGLLEQLSHSRYRRLINEPVRLSPAVLTILTDAHKILSEETHRLGTAAAELFRRCQRLQLDLRDQLSQVNDVANRIDAVVGEEDFVTNVAAPQGGNSGIEQRIAAAQWKQQQLLDRYEELRKKAARESRGRALTDKEKIWVAEVTTLSATVLPPKHVTELPAVEDRKKLWQRYHNAQALKEDLVQQAKEPTNGDGLDGEGIPEASRFRIPSEIRQQKYKQVLELLQRETALVEGAKMRLERLSLV